MLNGEKMNSEIKEVGAVCYDKEQVPKTVSLQEILLDERILAEKKIYVRKKILSLAGGVNTRLKAKRNYELLLRIAGIADVVVGNMLPQCEEEWCLLSEEEILGEADIEEALLTDCYVAGRYKQELLEWGYFEAVIMSLLEADGDSVQSVLEEMIGQGEAYYHIYDATQPILMCCGDDVCYAVLDGFARQFGKALEQKGQHVEYFDCGKEDFTSLGRYVGHRFKAIIGMQTYLFSVKKVDETFLHDDIIGPKYHFVFDHPVWMKKYLMETPKNLTVFTLDRNYEKFIKEYYHVPAEFFPPGGVEKEFAEEKVYGLSFMGTCGMGFYGKLSGLLKLERSERIFINRFIRFMKEDLNQPTEQVMRRTMEYYGISDTQEGLMKRLYAMRGVIDDFAQHYRRKVVESILKAGILLHVFGESWTMSSFVKYPNLICHERVYDEDCLREYAKSVITLNVMSWHKDSFTERIANAMLQKTVVVSDTSKYLEEYFTDGKDIILFDLKEMDSLPNKIKLLLDDKEKCEKIATFGYQKAKRYHTWGKRAEDLLQKL